MLEEGEQLEKERRVWQAQAGRSFLDKRANNVSRARSRSIGGAARPRVRPRSRSGERKAFEALAERTLLGNQTRPPTIHVHKASLSRSSQSQSQSQSATAYGTFQSTTSYRPFSRSGTGSRSRSHAHSNSLGNTVSYKSSSDETQPGTHSGSGHSRSQSLGKSAFKLVVSTATSAAAFCGLTNPTGEKGVITPSNEKPDGLESAIQNPGTKVIRLQDQIRAEGARAKTTDNLVVIGSMTGGPPVGSVSPTPSGVSGSGEGVGIAISPSDDHSRQHQGREPVRFAAHPYAQRSGYNALPIPPRAPESYGSPTSSPPATQDGHRAIDEVNRHRQPVEVHPYAQAGHPYATAIPQHRPQYINVPPNEAMYAELSPGYIREVADEDIRAYSPNIPTPTVVSYSSPKGKAPANRPQTLAPTHPYASASKRMSELAFGEALMHTMRRGSVDSGLGTSDHGDDYEPGVDWAARTAEMSPEAVNDIVNMHNVAGSSSDMNYLGSDVLTNDQNIGGVVSNQTVASSPMDHVIPPAFRRTASGMSRTSFSTKLGSSGSSPGMMSRDSSPPQSPRPLNTSEDLERFRDLFYRPSHSNSSESMAQGAADRPGPVSRSGSITFDVASQSTRSGLSTLVRQVSEDLEEVRQLYNSRDDLVDEASIWGRRQGGVRGPRPLHDRDSDPPNVVLARFASSHSGSSPRSEYDSPLRLPIDTSFVSPSTNIPEDVESSRASSLLELSPLNEERTTGKLSSIPFNEHSLIFMSESLRVGSIEAVSTPPIINTTQRFSTELSLVGHGAPDTGVEDRRESDYFEPRVASQRSTMLTPLSPNARSSYMTSNTDTSRMSGLSDFPVPPTVLPVSAPAASMSATSLHAPPPRLVREPSHSTFGRQDSASDFGTIGEAL